MNSPPRYTQIFNCYLEKGGEEVFVDELEKQYAGTDFLSTLRFHSSEWSGPDAPGRLTQALRMASNPDTCKKLRTHEKAQPSDAWILHNLFPVASGAVYREAERMGIPTLVYTHNFRPFSVSGYLWAKHRIETAGLHKNFLPEILDGAWRGSCLQSAWYAMILGWLHAAGTYKRITHWIAISEFMREKFMAAGVPPGKITTVRHPWFGNPPPDRRPADEGGYLFVGRLVEMKGIRFLMEAWQELAAALGDRTPLLHVCGDGPDMPWVRAKAEGNPRIRVHGHVGGEKKRRMLETCRCQIVPSLWWEPLGLVVYEAYAAGKPVMACRSGGLAELVLEGRTGWLIQPGGIHDLVGRVIDIEKNPWIAADLGQNGREWLLRNARVDDWKKQLEGVLADVVAEFRSRS